MQLVSEKNALVCGQHLPRLCVHQHSVMCRATPTLFAVRETGTCLTPVVLSSESACMRMRLRHVGEGKR